MNPYKKSFARDWAESLVFAVFAAAFIRMFLIEAYAIPTSSMEGSLKVGDCLFVSKVHYGLRTPMTIAMVPLLHNKIPGSGIKSYLKSPQLPYNRLPGLEKIDVLDKIVFNWPVGDSVYVTSDRIWSAGQVRRIPYVRQMVMNKKLTTHTTDKKEFYVKRCLGTPGDTIQIIDRKIWVNGNPINDPEEVQFKYHVTASNQLNTRLLERIGVSLHDSPFPENSYHMTSAQINTLEESYPDIKIRLIPQNQIGDIFPHDPKNFGHWTAR